MQFLDEMAMRVTKDLQDLNACCVEYLVEYAIGGYFNESADGYVPKELDFSNDFIISKKL
jgi:hypothetical protein